MSEENDAPVTQPYTDVAAFAHSHVASHSTPAPLLSSAEPALPPGPCWTITPFLLDLNAPNLYVEGVAPGDEDGALERQLTPVPVILATERTKWEERNITPPSDQTLLWDYLVTGWGSLVYLTKE